MVFYDYIQKVGNSSSRTRKKKAIVSYISKITLKVFIKVISNLKSKLPEICSKKDSN